MGLEQVRSERESVAMTVKGDRTDALTDVTGFGHRDERTEVLAAIS
jgi:hypothetical protein